MTEPRRPFRPMPSTRAIAGKPVRPPLDLRMELLAKQRTSRLMPAHTAYVTING
ncbi:hypothetical protein BH23CHL10_BH23CHL10_12110 [soil metagenome]